MLSVWPSPQFFCHKASLPSRSYCKVQELLGTHLSSVMSRVLHVMASFWNVSRFPFVPTAPRQPPSPPPRIYQSTLIFMWTPAHPMPASVTVLVTLNGSISSDWLGYPWQTDLLCSWKHRDVTCAWTMHSPGFFAWRDSLSSCLTSGEVTSNLP